MLKRYFRFYSAVALLLVAMPSVSRAQFGGSSIVFDPQMFARQLLQLQQETAAVTNLAQQLQYMVKNTTGGGAGVWQSNRNLLANLGGLISEQQGLSYTFQGLAQQFQQLYPGYNVTSTPGAQSPQASVDTTLNTLNGALQSAQSQAQNFQGEQAALQTLEVKNQTAIGKPTSSPRLRPSATTITSRRWGGGSSSSRLDRRRSPSLVPDRKKTCSPRGA